jgi:hypothetical protein
MRCHLFPVLTLLLFLGCGGHEERYRNVSLPSGRTIRLISIGTMHFSSGGPALILEYETDLPMTDVSALEKEVDDIWQTFRADVEKANMSNAVISASSKPEGTIVKTGSSYKFVFQKGQDGSWRRLANK